MQLLSFGSLTIIDYCHLILDPPALSHLGAFPYMENIIIVLKAHLIFMNILPQKEGRFYIYS